ncbi:MAG: beta-galactosidase, partial [Armatimonadota bacterium]|nr:beta-galactosidase [Armatimonadota bacterium]
MVRLPAPLPIAVRLLFVLAATWGWVGSVGARAEGRLPLGSAWVGKVPAPAELDACRDAGFTAVRLDVPWITSPDWSGLDQWVAAAAERKLGVILALQAAAPPAALGPVDPDHTGYAAEAKAWLQGAVEHFRGNPAVVAWMMPDEPEAVLRLTDDGFREYLRQRYGTLAALNAAWKWQAKSFTDISAAGVVHAAAASPLGISTAGIDLALFRQQAFTRLLRLWAAAVRSADASRPLLTGGMARYRCLISVPDEYDVVTARVAPLETGRGCAAESVAIARRMGRAEVVASLPSADPLQAFGAALLHGPAGIAVEDWRLLRAKPAQRAQLRNALEAWRQSGCTGSTPHPTVALLYQPFAERATAPSPLHTGYLAGADAGELEPLFAVFRCGTAYGQMGVLAREDLTTGVLSRVKVLLCPMVLSLTPEEMQALHAFALGGGVIVADAGMGCYEAGGEAFAWSSRLATLLGVGGFLPPIPVAGELRVYERCRLFPSLVPGATSAPRSFAGLAAPMTPLDEAIPLGAVADLSASNKRVFAGVLVRQLGKGWVVFASMKLWQHWQPADPLFTLFHGDLLSRGPAIALPAEPLFSGDVQAAAFDRGVAILNAGNRARLIKARVTGDDLYAGGVLNVCRAGNTEGVQVVAGLSGGKLGLYEKVPVRCVIPRGEITVAVESYTAEAIKMSVSGGRAEIRQTDEGKAVMSPSSPTAARLVIRDGRYPLRPGTLHRLYLRQMETDKVQEHRVRVSAEGKIEIRNDFFCEV